MKNWQSYAKALVGAAIAGLTALRPALDGGLTGAEVIEVVVATLVALGAVYAVPNREPK